MDRRWFLGGVGSVIGALVAPAAFKAGAAKVEVANPQLLPGTGVRVLLHQIADSSPGDSAPGFGAGCIWQELRTNRVWVNNGTNDKSKWHEMDPHGGRFLKMILELRQHEMTREETEYAV